jgi:hypothetical protein
VSFGWVRCVRYFGIEGTGASRQQAVWKFSFCPIFYRWIAVGAPGRCVSERLSLLTDGGHGNRILNIGQQVFTREGGADLFRKKPEKALEKAFDCLF